MVTRNWLSRMGTALIDFVYPPICLSCGGGIETAEELLCAYCEREIGADEQVRCRRCGCPVDEVVEGCTNCKDWKVNFERAVVMWRFGGTIQNAVHALKFNNKRELGFELGRRMGDWMRDDLREVDCLVPVPLHPARQRERGYNQSACIARGLAESLNRPVREDLVTRCKNTHQQAKLDAVSRRENLRNAFRRTGDIMDYPCIGLVDDVLTTGATLDACAGALLEGGGERVWAVVLASPFHDD